MNRFFSASGDSLWSRRVFTLTELLVVIANLSRMLLPALANATGAACTSNMKQLILGVHVYASYSGMRFPIQPE